MKKAVSPLGIIAGMIIVLVVIFTVIYIIRTKAEAAGSLMTSQELRFLREGCELRGKALRMENPSLLARVDRDLPGNNSDGYPDSCDFCIGGSDATDNDDDGIPFDCDDNDDPVGGARKSGVTLKSICEGKCPPNSKWKETNQCDIRPCHPPAQRP